MKKHKFTLVEILVVISIIAILSAFLFPAFYKVKESAKKIQCKTSALLLKTAILNYKSNYYSFPLNSFEDAILDEDDTDAYDEMIEYLSCIDGPDAGSEANRNLRRVQFLAQLPEDYETKGYCDVWGRRFALVIDLDEDNQIVLGGRKYFTKVLVYSFGPNGIDDKGGDDDIHEFD